MIEKIKQWYEAFEKQWWGGLLIYILAIGSVYSAIWSLIEPLNIPSQLDILGSIIDRRVMHISLSFFLGCHLTLILLIVYFWNNRKRRRLSDETSSLPDISVTGLDRHLTKICPPKNDLIAERVWMRDKKITQKAYASRVLLALNCEVLDERLAHELLRGSSFGVQKMSDDAYTLASK